MYKLKQLNALLAVALTLALSYTSTSYANATMELNGIATYTYLGKEQFVAGLYADTITDNPKSILLSDGRKQMEIKVVAKSLFSRRFKRLWIEGMAINAGTKELEKHAENVAAFTNMLKPRLKRNDILVISRSPRFGVDVSVNGIKLGNIEDPSFFDLLLRSWIGPVPLSSSFRQALMQKGKIEPSILAMYQNITPTPDRINEVQQAIAIMNTPEKVKPKEPEVVPEIETPKPEVIANTDFDNSESSTTEPTGDENSTESEAETVAGNDSEGDNSEVALADADDEEDDTPATLLTAPSFDDFEEEEEDDEVYTAENLLAEQLYYAKLMRWARRHNMNQKYPRRALRRNQQGTVLVAVTIERTGRVKQIALEEASQYKVLNQAAQKTVKRASPFPSMPDTIKADEYKFTVPVVFALKEM